jgi:hypothetical protein
LIEQGYIDSDDIEHRVKGQVKKKVKILSESLFGTLTTLQIFMIRGCWKHVELLEKSIGELDESINSKPPIISLLRQVLHPGTMRVPIKKKHSNGEGKSAYQNRIMRGWMGSDQIKKNKHIHQILEISLAKRKRMIFNAK